MSEPSAFRKEREAAIVRLDLHHLRTEVGQELCAIRSGHVLGQLQNAHTVEQSIVTGPHGSTATASR